MSLNPSQRATVGFTIGTVVGICVGWFAFQAQDNAAGGGSNALHAKFPPVEFLYLDTTRVLDYVAQLDGGAVGDEHLTTKQASSVNGEASVSDFKVGASSQREDAAESTLKQTQTSRFVRLLDDLREDHERGVAVHPVNPTTPAGLEKLHEGWLIRFNTRYLLSPGYIRPYVVVRQTATLPALFPGSESTVAFRRAKRQREKARIFAHQVGPDPRITFDVTPPTDSVKILMPMQYDKLTDERSLLERGRGRFTGGRLTVVGKVIHVFPCALKARTDHCEAQDHRLQYTDFATREIWRRPLEGASNYLIDHLSHGCPGTQAGSDRRECIIHKLEHQTELKAPGAVILPIAVYK